MEYLLKSRFLTFSLSSQVNNAEQNDTDTEFGPYYEEWECNQRSNAMNVIFGESDKSHRESLHMYS